MVRAKLAQLVGDDTEVPEPLLGSFVSRAQGNPFYAEELLNYVDEQEVDLADEAALRSLELPGSLHSLVLSRIDTLTEAPRRTLKVASVVGRSFRAPGCRAPTPSSGRSTTSARISERSCELDLVTPTARTTSRTSSSTPSRRRSPTRASRTRSARHCTATSAATSRRHEPDSIERSLDLLAHHFWHSDDEPRKAGIPARAGDAAQAAYANAAAIEYYERLRRSSPSADRVAVLLELGKVLELVGRWDDARGGRDDALELAAATGDASSAAWCETALAEVARKQGASTRRANGSSAPAPPSPICGEEEGVGRVLHLGGTLAAQRGDNAAARRLRGEPRDPRGPRRPAEIAGLLSNLGIIAEWEGDHELARRPPRAGARPAPRARRPLGDRRLDDEHRHERDAPEARRRGAGAVRGGDAALQGGRRSLVGRARPPQPRQRRAKPRRLPRGAVAVRASMRTYRDYGDRWALALLLEDVALLAALTGDPSRALELIGSRREPSRRDRLAARAVAPGGARRAARAGAHAAGRVRGGGRACEGADADARRRSRRRARALRPRLTPASTAARRARRPRCYVTPA